MNGVIPIIIPHEVESSRNRRTKEGVPMFIKIIPVEIKSHLFKDAELIEYPPENICINEIIKFREDENSPFKTTPLTDVELIDEWITIKGSPDEFQRNLDKLRETK